MCSCRVNILSKYESSTRNMVCRKLCKSPWASQLTTLPWGPIIRISPYELHIDEPDYYEELYSYKPRNKYAFYVSQFGLPGSTFSTVDYRFHRVRRGALSPFFSKQNVNHLEPMISYMVEKFCVRVDACRKSGEPMPMRQAYMCLTTDIITLYALNRSWNHLDSPDFSPFWVETLKAIVKVAIIAKFFPWILPLSQALPMSVTKATNPGMAMLLDFQHVRSQTARFLNIYH